MDSFVCARIVRMRDADLTLFQFDWDNTWAVFFMTPDGTILGRYACRRGVAGQADDFSSVPGLVAAAEGALELWKGYPANASQLAGKKGPKPLERNVVDLQGLQKRFPSADGTKGCVHCHHVFEGMREEYRAAKKPLPDQWMYPFPMPDAAGLEMELDARARVKAVLPGSAAAKAGFKAGDDILRAAGQPVISVADVQWVLQTTKAPADVPFEVSRDGASAKLKLSLSADWRKGDISWRESTFALRPRFRSDDIADDERIRLGLAVDALALKVRQANPQGEAAKNGLRQGDIILQIDDQKGRMTETEFLVYLWQKQKRGDKVQLVVLDGKKKKKVEFTAP